MGMGMGMRMREIDAMTMGREGEEGSTMYGVIGCSLLSLSIRAQTQGKTENTQMGVRHCVITARPR